MPKPVFNPVIQSTAFIRMHRAFFVGLFLLIPGVIITFLLFYTLMKMEFMHGWVTLHAVYENSYGLTKGNQVTISGMSIGHVNQIKLERERRVWVEIRISDKYQHLIRKDTKAQLRQKNFMVGDWNIELTGGSESTLLVTDGDTLNSELPFQVDKTINQLTGVISAIDLGVRDVFSGKGTVGKLLTEDSLINLVYQAGNNINGLTDQTKRILSGTDTFIVNLLALSRAADGIMDTIQTVSNKISSAVDSVDKILADVKLTSSAITPVIGKIRNDISDAEIMMKSIQNSWIMRKLSGPQTDPILKENP
ncbi:MAG TPA: MlaD family protein [Chitinispirillaceae bacterium]|nr:MlaD family protein [Chitinispirillaceae bacterium]